MLSITATTTDDAIDAAIPYLDMRAHALEMRDMAAAVLAEQGDQEVLQLHAIDGVDVLYSPAHDYAYVNQSSGGTGNSLILNAGEAESPEVAAAKWAEIGE